MDEQARPRRGGAWLFVVLASIAGAAIWLKPSITVVRGGSMEPALRDGQRCLLMGRNAEQASVGDLVVAEVPERGLVLKRVAATAGQAAPEGPWRRRLAISKTGLGKPVTLPGLSCDAERCTVDEGFTFVTSDRAEGSSDSRHFGALQRIVGRILYCF